MISPATAALAVSIAKGVIKSGGRLDRLMAEKAATKSDIVLPMPQIAGGLTVAAKAREHSEYLEKTSRHCFSTFHISLQVRYYS